MYLEHHLLSVIHGIGQAGDIQLGAIGICHPVERYYTRSMTINALEELDGAVLELIEQLLCESPRPPKISQGGWPLIGDSAL